MATRDLGSIQVETGAAVPDAPRVDVLGGLLEGTAAIIEGVGDIKVAQKREDLNEIADAAITEQSAVEVIDAEDIGPRTGSLEADKLLDRIEDLERKRNQTSGSTLANVNLKLRQSVEELRTQWPGLSKKLGAELTNFSALDPEMQALRMMEGQNTAYNKQAAADLAEIYDKAYAPLPHGLGLIPGLQRKGSVEFANAYMSQAGMLEERNIKDSIRLTLEAGDKLDSRENGRTFKAWMSGRSSVVSGYIERVNVDLNKVAAAFNNPTDPTNARIIHESAGAFNDLDNSITSAIFDIEERLFQAFPAEQVDDVAYTSARAMADQMIGVLQGLQEGLATGDASLVNAYAGYKAYRDLEFEHKNPELADTIRNLSRVTDLITAMGDDLDGDGLRVRHDYASYMNNNITPFLFRALGGSRTQFLPANATVQDVINQGRSIRGQNSNRYGTGQATPEGYMVGASAELANGKTAALMEQAKAGNISPNIAGGLVVYKQSNIDDLILQGEVPDDAMQDAIANTLADGILELAESANKESPVYVDALINRIEEGLNQYDEARVRQYTAWASEPLAIGDAESVSVFQVIELDTEAVVKGGQVVFSLNEEKLDVLLGPVARDTDVISGTLAVDRRSGESSRLLARNESARRRARDLVTEMNREVQEDLNISGNLMALKGKTTDVNWADAWINSGLKDAFGKLEEEE